LVGRHFGIIGAIDAAQRLNDGFSVLPGGKAHQVAGRWTMHVCTTVSDNGRNLQTEIAPLANEVLERAVSGMSPIEIQEFRRMLKLIINNLTESKLDRIGVAESDLA
jgi:hypothetical protein